MLTDNDLQPEVIISWAVEFASFEDLEIVAKALYGIYVQRRKNDFPDIHKENRRKRRQLTHTGEYRIKKKPKSNKWKRQEEAAKRQLKISSQRLGL